MLKRWFPKEPILLRALYGILGFIVCMGLAGGLRTWDDYQHGWPGNEQRTLSRTIAQYGPSSPEAATAIKQLGEKGDPKEVIALLDPATGKAIAAWPADLVGKKPEEMVLASKIKLPAMEAMLYQDRFGLEPVGNTGNKELSVRLTPLFLGKFEDKGEGERYSKSRGGEPQFGADQYDRMGKAGGKFDPMNPPIAPVAPKPPAFLLVAAFERGVTPLLILAGLFGALAMVGFAVFWLSLAWWVFADARKRGGQGFAWGVLVLLTNVVGAVVYLIARQQQQTCGTCGAISERNFTHCPQCGTGLKQVCHNCGKTLRRDWAYCVNCGVRHEPPQSGTLE
jgi:hypothetical protein